MAEVEIEDSNSEDSGLFSVQGRQGNVTFRPYRDIKTKTLHVHHKNDATEDNTDDDAAVVATCVDNLYPELLCHIFSYLDTVSKGNTAQVRKNILKSKIFGYQIHRSEPGGRKNFCPGPIIVIIFKDKVQSRYLVRVSGSKTFFSNPYQFLLKI